MKDDRVLPEELVKNLLNTGVDDGVNKGEPNQLPSNRNSPFRFGIVGMSMRTVKEFPPVSSTSEV